MVDPVFPAPGPSPSIPFESTDTPATRRIDERGKKDAYLTIPSLSAYVLIEQEIATVTVYRRTEDGFQREVYSGLDATIALGAIETELTLAELFDGVELVPEPDEDAGP